MNDFRSCTRGGMFANTPGYSSLVFLTGENGEERSRLKLFVASLSIERTRLR